MYTEKARTYLANNPTLSREQVLLDFAGHTEDVWTAESLAKARILLGGLYSLSVGLFVLGLVFGAEGLGRTEAEYRYYPESALRSGSDEMRYDLRGHEDVVETLKNLASAAHLRFVWFEDDPDETGVLNDPLARRLFDIGRQMEQGLHRFEFVEDLDTFPTKEDLVRHVEEAYAFARSSLEELGRVGSEQLADVPERLRDHVRRLLESVTTLMRQALVLGDMVHDLREPTNAEGAVPELIPSTYRHLEDDLKHFHVDDRFDRSVFVMMKFPDPAHMETWQVACLEDLYGAVKDELDRHGLVARRADKKTYAASKQLWDNLSIYMLGCRYGVAILEDHVGNELNPNVALEYGFMKGLGREVILLKERRFKHLRADLVGTIPKEFDIATDHTVDRRSLQDAVSNWLTDISVPPKRSR